jgi:hypothetical protein
LPALAPFLLVPRLLELEEALLELEPALLEPLALDPLVAAAREPLAFRCWETLGIFRFSASMERVVEAA